MTAPDGPPERAAGGGAPDERREGAAGGGIPEERREGAAGGGTPGRPHGSSVEFVRDSRTNSTLGGPAWLPRTPGGRVAAGLAAAIALFVAAIVAIERLAPTPRGPESSSYATAPAGLAAYADLLRGAGHEVERRRRPLAEGPRLTSGTLVVLDASAVPPSEARAIARFVRGGGRLIAGGARPAPWLSEALDRPPERRDADGGDLRPLAPVPETAGAGAVRAVDGGAWEELGDALPVLGPADAPLAVVERSGRGRVVLLADASPLQNRALGALDNAAFGLALAASERVTFLETVHGYGAETGLAALPESARWALLGLVLAGIAFAWSHARRIGPPEEDELPLPPPRADYVDALAGALVRTRAPADVARPLRDAARDRLARRAGLGLEPQERELREAADRFGLADDEAAALVAPPRDLAGALAAGRALARLESAATMAAGGGASAAGTTATQGGAGRAGTTAAPREGGEEAG